MHVDPTGSGSELTAVTGADPVTEMSPPPSTYLSGTLDGISILRIDASAGAVTLAGRLPVPLADAAAVSLGTSVVVLGGGGRAVYEF